MSSLSRIFLSDRDPNSVVAWRWDSASGLDRRVGWADFRRDVACLTSRLERSPAGAWLVEVTDPYACAVSLFALWNTERSAVLPPNLQTGSLAQLENRTAGVLSDRPERRPFAAAIDPLDPDGDQGSLGELHRDTLALELFSSGTTGDEKRIPKRLRHLEDEVALLEETWGSLLGRASVISTASHHHLYGLLFGLLWPLAAGRPLHAQQLLRPSELFERAHSLGDCALVSVPAHLRRLAQHGNVGALAGRCRAIFSSGGPLPNVTAARLAAAAGAPAIEVLGSTETGGIAWRTQRFTIDETPWQPLRQVDVARDPETGAARVRSPFVSVGDPDLGFATADRIELLPNGSFRLYERIDRVVKVGEKRLDLSRMESDLRSHDLVSDAALLLVERANEPRVAAVLVLTPVGERLLRAEGRRALTQRLSEHLGQSWDSVLIPRLWRTAPALPENFRGKLAVAPLRALFESPLGERTAIAGIEDRPEVLEAIRSETSAEWRCRVPPDLSCWPGHFPDSPVVPGVLQVDWAMDLASELLGGLPRLCEVEQVTFRDPLRPGDTFRIRVDAEANAWLRFRIWSEGAEHASGRARVQPSGAIEP